MNNISEQNINELLGTSNTLIGPLKSDQNFENILSSYEILGDYSASPDVMTFGQIDLKNQDFIDTSFKNAISSLPANWSKDKIIFWGVDDQIIPDGLEDTESPLIGVVFNWHYSFESVVKNISRFDWIFTDKKGEEVFKKAGFNNVSSILLRGFSPYLHRKSASVGKNIDISFIADLTPDIHRDREKYVYKIASLGNEYNIRVSNNVYGDYYVNMLNQSKISFNICSNQRVNQRCFEIPACNSLLFVEEDNLEIRDYFTDKESCVLYNETNFEELIRYYLKNDEERERITANGYKKVQKYSFENLFENLLEEIEKLDLKEIRKNRTFSGLDEIVRHKAKAKQAFQSNISGKFYIVERELRVALNKVKSIDTELFNNLGVINSNAFFALTDRSDKNLLTIGKNYLNEAIGYGPMYALPRFNLGSILYMEQEYEKAEEMLNSFIMLVSSNPEKAMEKTGYIYIMPNISYQTDLKMAWEKVTYENYNDNVEKSFGYCDLLIAKSFELLGDILVKRDDNELAEEMYRNALQVRDDIGNTKLSLANLLNKHERLEEAVELYREVFNKRPLELEVWKSLLDVLKRTDNKEEYNKLSSELKVVSKISPKYRKYSRLFQTI